MVRTARDVSPPIGGTGEAMPETGLRPRVRCLSSRFRPHPDGPGYQTDQNVTNTPCEQICQESRPRCSRACSLSELIRPPNGTRPVARRDVRARSFNICYILLHME